MNKPDWKDELARQARQEEIQQENVSNLRTANKLLYDKSSEELLEFSNALMEVNNDLPASKRLSREECRSDFYEGKRISFSSKGVSSYLNIEHFDYVCGDLGFRMPDLEVSFRPPDIPVGQWPIIWAYLIRYSVRLQQLAIYSHTSWGGRVLTPIPKRAFKDTAEMILQAFFQLKDPHCYLNLTNPTSGQHFIECRHTFENRDKIYHSPNDRFERWLDKCQHSLWFEVKPRCCSGNGLFDASHKEASKIFRIDGKGSHCPNCFAKRKAARIKAKPNHCAICTRPLEKRFCFFYKPCCKDRKCVVSLQQFASGIKNNTDVFLRENPFLGWNSAQGTKCPFTTTYPF